jgi:hypothetical protein
MSRRRRSPHSSAVPAVPTAAVTHIARSTRPGANTESKEATGWSLGWARTRIVAVSVTVPVVAASLTAPELPAAPPVNVAVMRELSLGANVTLVGDRVHAVTPVHDSVSVKLSRTFPASRTQKP